MPVQVAVCGPRECTEADQANAYEVGQLLARAGATVICGGGTGVMAAVSAGARSEDGLVIGVRPGANADDANPDLSAVIVTNIGEARNAVIIWSADAVIVIGGSWGTLSELALAKRRGGIPVINLNGWTLRQADGTPPPDAPTEATSATEAVDLALRDLRFMGPVGG
ncbi:TIGR00725 family protein [Pseudonocardia spinosispora]|uniref:TIGR00725 family protein n=1 Tax=Pseudonocardia spinosispora TaxID=103441 RepID=UPI000A024B44|nr:TIGR00725 family protein [Pseudonocardia spinosispora]